MTTDRKFRLTVTTETGPALSPEFLEFLKCKLVEAQTGAALEDSVAAEKAEFLGRLLGSVMAGPHPKGRPTLVYSRKAPMERAPAE
jgi:hypothetical protein